ncbi:MAG TPA: GMC family oxidoreductase [Stellaceae bacterium]|jgi:choline dehydrogenase-like flavoprotein|nr:GMC family oxidoreductase [Stellaceae bacterium]
MIIDGLPAETDGAFPVVVVGAGPAGIVLALELRRRGVDVVLLAGGLDGFDANFQALADADIADPATHSEMHYAVRRALGGTSLLWGGRCVPFDDIDFAARPQIGADGWPVDAAEIAPWYDQAMAYLDAGANVFSVPLSPSPEPGDARFDRVERWSNGRNMRRLHAKALQEDSRLRVCLGAVATGFDIDPASGRVTALRVADRDGQRRRVPARAFVLACGGLETTRLMLAARLDRPLLFGGTAGVLGRYYMGHIEGRIAEIVFTSALPDTEFAFAIDQGGRYFRRRITIAAETQQRDGLLNLSAWPDNPPLGDARHGSAILSLACLALATPGLGALLAAEAIRRKHLKRGALDVGGHLANIFRDLPQATREAAKFLYGRFVAQPRIPGFFLLNKARRYTFLYHAEQAPNPASAVTLAEQRDALGMPRLRIDLRFGEIDGQSVVASHRIIDAELRRTGLGRLEYAYDENERVAQVLAQATDGFHQIGTTRMSTVPAMGVVDRDLRVHGTPNLYVASSSVFPTSSQANPTLLLAAFSARLAAHLAERLPDLAPPGSGSG